MISYDVAPDWLIHSPDVEYLASSPIFLCFKNPKISIFVHFGFLKKNRFLEMQ